MMGSRKQKEAAKENIRKAQEKWQSMSSHARLRAQPKGNDRKTPGADDSTGEYYHVRVRRKDQFSSFRTHDIGREGHHQRVAGHRPSGSWSTQKWLISKDEAHVEGDELIADTPRSEEIMNRLQGPIMHVKGDIFEAGPRRNVPERMKPTPAQQKARNENIQKAQQAGKYESRTKKELYELAKKRDIENRSRMDKDELLYALREEEN